MSSNLQNILDNALTEFFSNSEMNFPLYDICYSSLAYNYLNFDQNFGQNLRQNFVEEKEEEGDLNSVSGSMPDLIPIDNIEEQEQEQEQEPIMESSQPQQQSQQITLWYQLIEDYNAQIHTYQQNIQSIINITENILPVFNNNNRNNRRTNINSNFNTNSTNTRQNLISQLRNLFRNNEYILEFENITPLIYPQQPQQQQPQILTSQEIQNATELFIHNSIHPLIYHTCPITLEEFREGEPLMRIIHCGHIFKAFELQRWFLRNTKCPSCRYDIRTGSSGI